MDYAIQSTAILAILILSYITGCKIMKRKVNWDWTAGVSVGHIIFLLLYAGIEKTIQWYLNG